MASFLFIMKVLILMVIFTVITVFQTTHTVSWYDLHGRRMANGDIFNKHAMTCAASKKYKMGEVLEVTALKTMKKVNVTVTDRGNFEKDGIALDLSRGAFKQLFPLEQGLGRVYIRRVSGR